MSQFCWALEIVDEQSGDTIWDCVTEAPTRECAVELHLETICSLGLVGTVPVLVTRISGLCLHKPLSRPWPILVDTKRKEVSKPKANTR